MVTCACSMHAFYSNCSYGHKLHDVNRLINLDRYNKVSDSDINISIHSDCMLV